MNVILDCLIFLIMPLAIGLVCASRGGFNANS